MNGERLHPATPFVKAWLIVVAFVWFVGRQVYRERDSELTLSDLPWWAWLFLTLPLFFMLLGAWSWWITRFFIDDTELRIEQRGLSHESRRIAYTRIQSIDLTQPFAARLLGLAELTIDVGAGESATLSYLSRGRADELRYQLLKRAQAVSVSAASSMDASEPHTASSIWDDHAPQDQVLVRLQTQDLILGAALAHQLWLLVLVLGVGPLVAALLIPGVPLEAFGAGALPLIIAVWGFVANRVTSQFRYTLAQTPNGLKITRGMTTLRTQTVPVHRVQAVRITQSILWRLIGRQRVDLVVLGGGGSSADNEDASGTLLPIGTPTQVRAAINAIWPDFDHESIAITPPPPRARWLAPLAYPWLGYGHDDRVAIARTGWLTRTIVAIPHHRLQSLNVSQGPIDHMLGVATVSLHTSKSAGTGLILIADTSESRSWIHDEIARARA